MKLRGMLIRKFEFDYFFAHETEKQTLPLGKWFLDRQRKRKNKKKALKKKRKNQRSSLGFKLPMSRMPS